MTLIIVHHITSYDNLLKWIYSEYPPVIIYHTIMGPWHYCILETQVQIINHPKCPCLHLSMDTLQGGLQQKLYGIICTTPWFKHLPICSYLVINSFGCYNLDWRLIPLAIWQRDGLYRKLIHLGDPWYILNQSVKHITVYLCIMHKHSLTIGTHSYSIVPVQQRY